MKYIDFLRTKVAVADDSGMIVSPEEVSRALKPHQRDAVIWALRGGRRALFESFGLGKTAQQLEFCRIAIARAGGKALIVCPLGVKQEFQRDAEKLLGYREAPTYIKDIAEASENGKIYLTNYERVRDGNIDPKAFTVTSLDEASVLRSFGSKTYQTFLDKFQGVPYKLVCTATPSPNRYKELIHYSGYLEIMDTGQALTRFFQRDSTKANNLTLYPHMEREFWLWLSSWALFINLPSDMGYDDTGYALPPMEVRYHCVNIEREELPVAKDGQMQMWLDPAVSLSAASRIKNDSIHERIKKAIEIVQKSPEDHFILWHDREAERQEIKRLLPEAVEIFGSQDLEIRERNTISFSDGEIKILATKKSLSGSGCNFQRHCHRAIFCGTDYEFNDFIQAIHRVYRFQQKQKVIIDIIYTAEEENILRVLREKWKNHNELTDKMTGIIREYGLSGIDLATKIQRSMGVKRVEVTGKHFKAINNDCILETEKMESNSVGLIHTSIPFSNHYEYTPKYNDFGHNANTEKFFEQMDFLTPQLLRILQPGRIYAVHVKDRVLFGNVTGCGFPTMEPFHMQTTAHCMKHGFEYIGMITITTDVVRENNQTYRLGWTEQCKDGTKMGVGCPEYVLLFRKRPTDSSTAYADVPVTKTKEEYTRAKWQLDAHGFWRSSGDRYLTKDEIKSMDHSALSRVYKKYSQENIYDYQQHVSLCEQLDTDGRLPATFMAVPPASWSMEVWDDINRMRTLNTTQSRRNMVMHVCPLQLDVVERVIERYSNPGDIVYDPFGGLMTVPMVAVQKGRYGIGCELSEDYFRDGVGYLKEADAERNQPTLFDFIGA